MAATKKCFPRRHMPAAVDSFYWFLLNRYKKAHVVWRDEIAFADEYRVSRNTIRRWIQFLEREQWIVPRHKPRRNRQTGMYESIPYDIVEHDAWARTHPDQCHFPGDSPCSKIEHGRADKSKRKRESAIETLRGARQRLSEKRVGKTDDDGRKKQDDPCSKIEHGTVLKDSVSPCSKIEQYVVRSISSPDFEGKTTHDAEPRENRQDSAIASPSQNQGDENERTTRDPSDALLIAARVLAKEHGITTGINLAAYICAHAIQGTGAPPRTVTYYTTSAQGYLPDGDPDFPRTGNTDHHIHPEMIEDGLDRLRRAAERMGHDLYDAIAQLEEMGDEIAAREEKTAMPKTPAESTIPATQPVQPLRPAPFCQPKPIPCGECGETFANAVELAHHLPCQSTKRTGLQVAA